MAATSKKTARRSVITVDLAPVDGQSLKNARRKMLADWCRLIGQRLRGEDNSPTPSALEGVELTPRLRQTLSCLLVGDSEKQIAVKLKLSPHTIHTYVKHLHKRFNVASRGELLAKFVSHGAAKK